MNITILNNREVIIDKLYNVGTQNENNATIFNFTFPENLLNSNKKIVFITPDGNFWDLIVNNSYKITNALTKYKTVSAYVWLVDVNNDIDFRSKIWKITFNDNQEADDVIPTEEEINGFDTMIAQLNSAIAEVDNIDINANKSGTVSTVTITNKEGIEKSVEINDGTDYVITEEDYRNIADIVESEISLNVPTKTSDLTNDSGFIDNTVNNLINYTLKTNTGSLIDLEINSTTYVVTLSLKDIDGTVISTDTIDLPLESVVVSGRYDNTTKQVILTLENGSEVAFSVADLVAGLQTEITSQNKLASDLVDDSNSGNKFVTTSEKNTWNAKYDKPSGGIPDTDLSSAVQTSLGKADTALQEETYTGTITSVKMNGNTIATSGEADLGTVITEHQDITGKEDKSNKVTSIDENSTNTQYPGAKLVYDELSERDEYIEELEAQIPENTVTGTDITVTDSANMKIAEFELEGQTEQVQYSGKNLLINNATNGSNNGITWTIQSDGGIKIQGTTTAQTVIPVTFSTSFELAAGTYTLSGQNITAENMSLQIWHSTASLFAQAGVNPKKITINNDTTYQNFRSQIVVPNGLTIDTIIYCQLESGSSATSYEPYVGGTASPNPDYPQDVHVVTGECEVEFSNKNLWSSEWEHGVIDPDSGNVVETSNAIITKNFIKVFSNKEYYISRTVATSYMSYRFYDKSYNYLGSNSTEGMMTSNLSTKNMQANNYNQVITINNTNVAYMKIMDVSNDLNTKYVLQYNSTATDYIEHKEQVFPLSLSNYELCKIGNYQDYIYGSTDNWYVYNAIGKAIFDGSEEWTVGIYGTNSWDLENKIETTFNTNELQILSSVFKGVAHKDRGTSGNNIIYTTANKNIEIRNTTLTTKAQVQSVTNGTPIYYVLATPTNTKITDPTLISQLNALYKAKTYKNTTHITTTGEDLQPILKLTYKQDLQTLFNKLDSLESRIELLES